MARSGKRCGSSPGARYAIHRARNSSTNRQGTPKSRLDGRLIAFKDNICTRDLPTTCASQSLETFTSPFNATVVEQLEKAGAIVAGKTNLDEFGMGSHSIHSHFGPVKSARCGDAGHLSAGGSSGGSAVAVATDQCYSYVMCRLPCVASNDKQCYRDGHWRICPPSCCVYRDSWIQAVIRVGLSMGCCRIRKLAGYSWYSREADINSQGCLWYACSHLPADGH
jgi:aspartyl-tRNA(Asn)/glutamyl-tRNA(Gln) amidotransferase subunit A